MLTALSDPKTLAEIAVVVALVAMNAGPLLSWAASKAAGIKGDSVEISPKGEAPSVLQSHEVAWFDNSLTLPPSE